jgi:hypothetical protein
LVPQSVADRKKYYRKWYKNNRDDLLDRRRDKRVEFRRDHPDYKAPSVVRRLLDRRLEFNKKRQELIAKAPLGRTRRPVIRDGVTYFHSSFLSHILGVRKVTIAKWERLGVLPKTPFRRRGARLYTVEMIEAVQVAAPCVIGLPRGKKDRALFYRLVVDRWKALGVKITKPVEI